MSAVLATRIGRWLVDFWKICGPLFCVIFEVLFRHVGLVFLVHGLLMTCVK